jgi:NADH-quinone oxidoreductase subunit G
MQFAPSICQQCSVGCNISPGERYGELRRVENRFNGSVNHYFLCDRGRFGYGYVNRSDRPRQPMMREGAELAVVSVDEALDSAIAALRGKKLIGIGSPRASLETNFALRSLVGEANFSTGIAAAEQACISLALQVLQTEGIETPTLRDIESKDGVLVLGEDVTQTAPRIALALRQSVKNKAVKLAADRKTAVWQDLAVKNIAQHELSPLFITSFSGTRLDDVATGVCMSTVDDQARIGFAIAHCIDSNAPAVAGLDAEAQAFARQVADALLAANKPLVVAGTSAGSQALIQSAANIVQALLLKGKQAAITLTVPEVNSLGVSLVGGLSVEDALESLKSGQAEIVVIAENDLYRRAPAALVDAALAKAAKVIVLDHQQTATTAKADILMSAASFAEGDGTVVSNEGRAQRYFQVYDSSYYKPEHQIKEGWRWLHAIHSGLDYRDIDWTHLDDVVTSCADAIPVLAGMVQAAPNAAFRISGVRPAREPRRYSGRTAMRAKLSVHEPRQPQDGDSALAFSMEGYVGPKNNAALTSFAWAPGWNSPQAWNKFQAEVGGHLRAGDPGVRLLDSAPRRAGGYFKTIPAAFVPRADGLSVHLLHHIFGSDELAARADVMASRLPEACITVSADDAARLRHGQTAIVSVNMKLVKIPARIDPEQPSGTVGVIAGVPGLPVLQGGEWLQVSGEGA